MLPPALPAPPPVAVSAETRLAYVLRHFWLAYPGSLAVSVGYADMQPQVEIAEVGEAFFDSNTPYPAAPNWREWAGKRVPFFFDQPAAPLLVLQENRAIISADIISAAFYLLSGWQEYFSTDRDRHGRFPYAASVQQQYGFVELPVVNYYFDVLRAAIEHVSGQPLQPRRWGPQQAAFAAFISHDIDNLHSAWKAPAKAAFQERKFGLFGQLLWQHLTRPDAWDNLEAVAAAVAQYSAKSTFFILPSNQKSAAGTPNADYTLTEHLVNRLRKLFGQGACQLGLHIPLGIAASAPALTKMMRAGLGYGLSYSSGGVRFHYLCWEPRQTPAVLTGTDVCFDSTLGFAEHFGFRHSYCHPFFPFNFAAGQEVDFWEFPLTVMDTTLRHPAYLQLEPEAVLPALRPVFEEAKKFGGLISLLWHNENFDPANHYNGPRQFHEIMAYLQQQGAAFPTGVAVVESYW